MRPDRESPKKWFLLIHTDCRFVRFSESASLLPNSLSAPELSRTHFDTQASARYPRHAFPPPGHQSPCLSLATKRHETVHASPSVLIVDRSEETREVLETALEKRGIRTFSASRAGNGAELARSQHPDLIVLDLELDRSSPDALCSKFRRGSACEEPPMVLLGSMAKSRSHPRGEFVAKPYHYGPLIRRIEEILETVNQDSRDAA
jgi:CheY-like chemotaxis protein